MTLWGDKFGAAATALGAWLPSASKRRVVAGMATMPSRAATFPAALQSIIGQVDRLYLYLDGHDDVPEPARGDPRVVPVFSRDEPELGGAGKFLGALRETEPCLYVCVDDDILYPPDFVARLVRELAGHHWRAVVGVHGIKLRRQLRSYLSDRDVLYFRRALPRRQVVDALGTGTLMFDTGVFKFDAHHWPQKDMADMQVAIEAAKAGLPMVCIARRQDFLRPLEEMQADSIYAATVKDDSRITLLALELQAILASHERSTEVPGIEVFAMHGVIDGLDPGRFGHRNLMDTGTYRALLQGGRRFVPLAEALEGGGPALTIDDATVAAARAAELARDLGHDVTLFINPWQIEDGRPSWFSRLDGWLDEVDATTFSWEGRDYDLSTRAGRETFRTDLKAAMRKHRSPEQSTALIDHIEDRLGLRGREVPDHLRCLSVADLRALQDRGVDIQNHSWTHLDPAALGPERFADEIRQARNWLRDTLGVDSRFFASAFGEYLPHPSFLQESETVCLLLHNHILPGRISDNIVNRCVLKA